MKPIDVWYSWPVHEADASGILAAPPRSNLRSRSSTRERQKAAEKRAPDRAHREDSEPCPDAVANANFGDSLLDRSGDAVHGP